MSYGYHHNHHPFHARRQQRHPYAPVAAAAAAFDPYASVVSPITPPPPPHYPVTRVPRMPPHHLGSHHYRPGPPPPPPMAPHPFYPSVVYEDDDREAYTTPYDDDLEREEREARQRLEAIQRRREAARLAAEHERAIKEAAARKRREADLAKQEWLRRYAEHERAVRQAEKEKQRKQLEEQIRRELLAEQREKLIAAQRQKQAAEQLRRVEQFKAEQQRAFEHDLLQQLIGQSRKNPQEANAQTRSRARPGCPMLQFSTGPSHAITSCPARQSSAPISKSATPDACPTPKPVKTAPVAEKQAHVIKAKDEKQVEQSEDVFSLRQLIEKLTGLGLEVADDNTKPDVETRDSDKVIDGLNQLLGQFGLVFEADDTTKATETKEQTQVPVTEAPKVDEPAKPSPSPVTDATTKAEPARPAQETRATTGLPDFLKYAFEMAMNDGQQSSCAGTSCCAKAPTKVDKGKDVAEGEKKVKTTSAPTPLSAPTVSKPASMPEPEAKPASPSDSIAKLKSIADEFALARDSFTFPDRLVFGPTSADPQHPPALLFNKTNSPYHAQTNKLLQLLLAADDVVSDGDKDVRQERKALVKQLEKEIELLEQKRDQLWEEVKAQREKGEEEVEVESVSSGSSVVDPVEHAEEHHVATPGSEVEASERPSAEETTTKPTEAAEPETDVRGEIAGFDVPTAAELLFPPPETDDTPPSTEVVPANKTEDTKTSPDVKGEPAQETSTTSSSLPELERKQSRQATVEDEKKEDEYELV